MGKKHAYRGKESKRPPKNIRTQKAAEKMKLANMNGGE